jgi:hypothetical protein
MVDAQVTVDALRIGAALRELVTAFVVDHTTGTCDSRKALRRDLGSTPKFIPAALGGDLCVIEINYSSRCYVIGHGILPLREHTNAISGDL